MYCINKRRSYSEPPIPIGSVFTIIESGEWECPCTGNYEAEIHGGGGGSAISYSRLSDMSAGAGGGGSGEVFNIALTKGERISVTIGLGGTGTSKSNSTQSSIITATGGTGGTSEFGTLSCAGGKGGYAASRNSNLAVESTPGAASGSLASDGESATNSDSYRISVSGGVGSNRNFTQTYGNGGSASGTTALDGEPGAVILTYLGR